MIQIRQGVFETNSSSTHSITIASESDFDKWKNGDVYLNDGWWSSSDGSNKDKTFLTKDEAINLLGSYECYKHNEDLIDMNDEELNLSEKSVLKNPTTDLVGYNYTAERKFKLTVLEWLTDGKPKLFRSPSEGNYVVRLMNTSLSPNDTLGRMIHSFSCTGYECAAADIESLQASGLVR